MEIIKLRMGFEGLGEIGEFGGEIMGEDFKKMEFF
jgi:hypothetical protein